jgi:hypothetical protein
LLGRAQASFQKTFVSKDIDFVSKDLHRIGFVSKENEEMTKSAK